MEETDYSYENHCDSNHCVEKHSSCQLKESSKHGDSCENDPAVASCSDSNESHCDWKSTCCRKQKRQLNQGQDSPDQKQLKLGSKFKCDHKQSAATEAMLGFEKKDIKSGNDRVEINLNLDEARDSQDLLLPKESYSLELCSSSSFNAVDEQRNIGVITAINELPYSILVCIFKQLSLRDLLHRACLVCKYWLHVSQDSDLWRNINLRAMMKVDDQVLARVTSYSDNVTRLDITDSRLIQSQGLSEVLARCSTLQSLKLIRCQQLGQGAFEAIGMYCHQLRKLFLEGCYMVTNNDLEQISRGCPSLEVLNVNQCLHISDDGIKSVACGCHRLRHLSMDHCTKVTDGCIHALVEGCPGLQELSCMSCDITDLGIRYLAQLKGLRILEVSNTRSVSGEGIMYLVKCCRCLESLNLSLCTSINDQCIEFIARHAPVIRHLYLVSCSLTDIALEVLGSHCKTIQTVDVGWCQQITDEGVRCITGKCGTLRHLGLMRCDKVSIPTTEQLVEAYPHITFSTMWLDWKRLLDKAERSGLLPLPPVLDGVGPEAKVP